MAEIKQMHTDNIKKINDLLTNQKVAEVASILGKTEVEAKKLKAQMEAKLAELKLKAQRPVEPEVAEVAPVEPAPVKAEEVVQPKKEDVIEQVQQEKVEKKVEEKKEYKIIRDKLTPPTVDEKLLKEEKPEKPEEVKPAPKKNEFIVERGVFIRTDEPKKKFNQKEFRPNQKEFRPQGEKPAFENRQGGDFGGKNPRSAGKKPAPSTYVAPPIVEKADKRNFNKKKQNNEKNYEEKRVVNKRSLIRNNVDVDDFDENKTGYRKFRPVKKAKEQSVFIW